MNKTTKYRLSRGPACRCGCGLPFGRGEALKVAHTLPARRPCSSCEREFQPTKIRRMLCSVCYRGGGDTRVHALMI